MRFYVAFAVIVASFAFTSQVHAADDELFSEVAMETVYRQLAQGKPDDAGSKIDLPQRMTGATSLIQLLTDAGFQPKQSNGRGVSVNIQQNDWKLSVYLKAEVDRDRLVIEMPLAKIAEGEQIDPFKLLKLLKVGNKEDDFYFTYNQDEGLIELRRVMDNRFTAPRIKQELSAMAMVAQTHADAWSDLGKTVKAQRTETSPTAPRTPSPKIAPKKISPAPNRTLVGTWSASLGAGEAFAIEIKRDTTFQLVHIKGGKSVTSSGKATKSGTQLTLADNTGNRIVGTVNQTTTDAFSLSISGTTLKFKKAK